MEFLGRNRKWWLEWALGYLVMIPLFGLGVFVAIEVGLGLGLGMFMGAGFAMFPILSVLMWKERRKRKAV